MSGEINPRIAWRTDVGKRREHNEDAITAEFPLLAVADGVGGSAKGEVASQLALDTLQKHTDKLLKATSSHEATELMHTAVADANKAVYEAQAHDETLRGMATTLTAMFLRDGGEIIVGHVGDSRMYVLSPAGVRMATTDHSVVSELVRSGRITAEEAASHPQRNVITRALGPEPDVAIDAFSTHVSPGDWILACSDGLTEHVLNEELATIVLENDPEEAVDALIALANERGGTDNITVVIAQPVPSDVSGEINLEQLHAKIDDTLPLITNRQSDTPAEASGPLPVVEVSDKIPALHTLDADEEQSNVPDNDTKRSLLTPLLVALAICIAAVGGAFVWSNTYFLTENDECVVAINQGFPLPYMSTPDQSSQILASELSKVDKAKFVDSHKLMSKSDAKKILNELETRLDNTTTSQEVNGAANTSCS